MPEHSFTREASLRQIAEREYPWDLCIIGGGATGASVALDAASRELDVVLVEKSDFGKGTSSRSTKLVHGGVRYLRQGNITLVRDALRERSLLHANAPHLVRDLSFMIPCRSRWQRFFYGTGLKLYDALASSDRFGRSRSVSAAKAAQQIPNVKSDQISGGGVVYHDGQFDDSRLLLDILRTAAMEGACLANYTAATKLSRNSQGTIDAVEVTDRETGQPMTIRAKGVINAAGPFCDQVRELDDSESEPMIVPSQGVHLVLPRKFIGGDTAVMVPKTSDGRVIFVIPWYDRVLVGTTDTPIDGVSLEPSATQAEIEFLLETAGQYLSPAPTIDDVLSIFIGIRPLVKGDKSSRTASLSRDHTIRVSPSGLMTISGGKWTTVRKMAEDCVDRAVEQFGLTASKCRTQSLALGGQNDSRDDLGSKNVSGTDRSYYGNVLEAIERLEKQDPTSAEVFDPALPLRRSDVLWAVRREMARTVDDVLSRRSRCLIFDARASMRIAPAVAELMGSELQRDATWCEQQVTDFNEVATHYLPPR